MLRLSKLVRLRVREISLLSGDSGSCIILRLNDGKQYYLGTNYVGELYFGLAAEESAAGFSRVWFPNDLADELNRLVNDSLSNSSLIIHHITRVYGELLKRNLARASVEASSSSGSSGGGADTSAPGDLDGDDADYEKERARPRAAKRGREPDESSEATVPASKRMKKSLSEEEIAELLDKGFTRDQLSRLKNAKGAGRRLDGLRWLLAEPERLVCLFDADFTIDNVVKILLRGGFNSLRALVGAIRNAAVWTKLKGLKFAPDDWASLLSHYGGSKNIETLTALVENAAVFSKLKALGIRVEQLRKLLSKNGGSKHLSVLMTLVENATVWTRLRALKIRLENLMKLLYKRGGSKNLAALKIWLEEASAFTVLDPYMDKPAQVVFVVDFLNGDYRGEKLEWLLHKVSVLGETYELTEDNIRRLALLCKESSFTKLSTLTDEDIVKELVLVAKAPASASSSSSAAASPAAPTIVVPDFRRQAPCLPVTGAPSAFFPRENNQGSPRRAPDTEPPRRVADTESQSSEDAEVARILAGLAGSSS